jgi:3-oxoacyl-[acyl-carrier protein] reductase
VTRALSRSPAHHPAGRLTARSVLVTGAASGVGLEIARIFHAEGALVFATGRNRANLDGVLEEADRMIIRELDVTNEPQCESVVNELLRETGGAIDVLVNNAGATIRGTIEETSSDQFTRTLELNLGSAVRLCRLIAPGMCRQRRGSIINMASITSTEGQPGTVAYTASKGGMTAMTRSLAVELAPFDVRVNAISPGVIDTPMTHDHVQTMDDPDARYDVLLKRQPMCRMASPRDVALASLFLASDESGFITGANLPVDGGRHAVGPA